MIALAFVAPIIALASAARRLASGRTSLVEMISLGAGLGLGLTSIAWFWMLVAGVDPTPGAIIVDSIVALAAAVVLWRLSSGEATGEREGTRARSDVLARIALGLLASIGLGAFWINVLAHSYGEIDSFFIWNLKARFVHLAGADGFDAMLGGLRWSHAGYPLLLPLVTARLWTALGADSIVVPHVIAGVFGASLLGLLHAAVRRTSGAVLAVGAVAAALLSPLPWATSLLIADVPLAYFMLAAVVLADRASSAARSRGMRRALILSGIAAGCAAWTKNEGLLFVVVLGAGATVVYWKRLGWREALRRLRWIALGLVPALSAALYFKLALSPKTEFAAAQTGADMLAKLLDPARHAAVASFMAGEIVTTLAIPLAVLGALLALAWLRHRPAMRRAGQLAALVATLQMLGYYGVYLITPYELQFHMTTSFSRLVVHLWPIALYAIVVRLPHPTTID
jgi:hypothetical protein